MNRGAKGFRVISGMIILFNLVAVFLPITVCTQENYPTLSWTTFDYILHMFSKNLPYGEAAVSEITTRQIIWIAGLMLLPAFLAVITCIWGIVGSARQMFSGLLAFVVSGIYGGMVAKVSYLWPVEAGNCVFSRGIACNVYIALAIAGSITALLALLLTPRRPKTRKVSAIPQVDEIRQEQKQARYNVILEEKQPAKPRGVMVGMKGMYKGAEIPFADGEYVKMGRLTDNHLVFERGQGKVSRNHCKIKWDSSTEKYTIVDYSSNGTFVDGAEDCLPQNLEIQLMPGTVIALGDETNVFRLE
ncbi:MAG: FHA domain-containing protein [Lachnospiraceae bacterium]|nr:FHA domain-containing protein [Lachnospiraceae bacterium]